MTIRLRYQYMLLATVVLGFYYPAIFGGYSPADDLKRLNHLLNLENFDFYRLFMRGGGYYYRPITASTFYLDQIFWGADALFMHVENLLVHLVNASLVFAIARRLCRQASHLPNWMPLLAALFFALHPINTEAVCWISGRYDLLATTFVLMSLWLLLWALTEASLWRMLPALLVALCGCLAKETALFAFGGAVLILYAHKRQKAESFVASIRLILPGFLLWCGTAMFYLVIRNLALSGRDSGVKTVINSAVATEGAVAWLDQLRIAVKVGGFYFKKMLFPYPLNFAIIEVGDIYLLVGIVFLFLCAWLVWRADLSAAFFLGSVITGSSALLVVFGKMAWTPVAERYLYMPSAFFALGLVVWAAACHQAKYLNVLKILMIFFVVIGGGMTIDRAILWSDPVALAEDTVAKSPNFVQGRKDLANYYLALGRVEEGMQLLESVKAVTKTSGYISDDISIASQLIKEGKLDEAHRILSNALESPGKQTVKLIKAMLILNQKRLANVPDEQVKVKVRIENIKLFEILRQRSNDPFLDYQQAKVHMALGESTRARILYELAYQKASPSAFYREPARKLAEKMAALQND